MPLSLSFFFSVESEFVFRGADNLAQRHVLSSVAVSQQ